MSVSPPCDVTEPVIGGRTMHRIPIIGKRTSLPSLNLLASPLILIALSLSGCVGSVDIQDLTLERVDGDMMWIVARLDSNLDRDYHDYGIQFEYSITDLEQSKGGSKSPGEARTPTQHGSSNPGDSMRHVEHGPFAAVLLTGQSEEFLVDYLRRSATAARPLDSQSGPPFKYRIYIPMKHQAGTE